MLKRDITYKDFNDKEVTDTFYFNLTKSEIVELEVGYKGGLYETIQRIIDTNDRGGLVTEFKRIVLLAYGQKSEDGKRFIKSEQLREEFSQTAAYDGLFIELATNDEAAANFIKGVLPADMVAEVENADKTNASASSYSALQRLLKKD